MSHHSLRAAHLPESGESRIRWIAALTLGAVMAGHTLLETARDALFLANVSVERLPFVTIAIALLALAVSQSPNDRSNRFVLLAFQTLAALGTLGLWSVIGIAQTPWAYYVLYVWSGVITSVIVVRFWLLLADIFTITQGKRLFAAIAMGGAVGAILGAGAATILAPWVGARGLLMASSGAFLLSASGPALGLGGLGGRGHGRSDGERHETISLTRSVHSILADPYACRIAVLVMIGGMTLTLGDYLFKSVLVEEVPADQLASWLARIYLGLNVLSIGMLGLGVTPILRRLGVDRSLTVLPALVTLAALGVLAGGALVATVFLKVADGTLRHSLHRTALELLYLPMSSRLRTSVKGAIDIVAQTGAKALASFLILGLVMWPDSRMIVSAAVVASASVWIMMALRLRHAYLDVFRETLREGAIETEIDHPELDLDSAESLISALSHRDERRVLAAMRILSERGHVDLIPSLILYHPSPVVVTHALDLFAITEREDLLGLLDHLARHENVAVRAASVRASWVLDPDRDRLRTLAQSDCLAVRVSALAGLLSMGDVEPEVYRRVLQEVNESETSEPRLAAAKAVRLDYHPVAREALLRMAEFDEIEVASEALRAICASGDDWFTEPLVGLLGTRRVRDAVRTALLERGDAGLRVLSDRLVDPKTPLSVLRHIPRTIARFESAEAARVLIDGLAHTEHGIVRFKLLQALETLLLGRGLGYGPDPGRLASVSRRGIRIEFERTVGRALELLEIEAVLSRVQAERPERARSGGELLVELLQDKRKLATGRLFMMLGLLHPQEDFRVIQEGLQGDDRTGRASALELVETLLPDSVSRAMLGLAIRDSSAAQVAVAGGRRKKHGIDYGEALRELLGDESTSVRAVALYHAGEIGLQLDRIDLQKSRSEEEGDRGRVDRSLQERALATLRDLSVARASGARPAIDTFFSR